MLTLHPDKGVNPRITCCTQCGEDVGLVLLGSRDFSTTCPSCNLTLIGGGKCPKCHVHGVDRKPIPEGARLGADICDECQKLNQQTKKMVEEGGIYFKCSDCGCTGSIKKDHPLSKAVRKQLGIEAPKPCGVEFSKAEGCPQCGQEEENAKQG